MQTKGRKLIRELKLHIMDTMNMVPECGTDGPGCSFREIEDLAGLSLDLPAQDGWLTWSVLAALAEENKAEALRRGRRLYWRIRAPGPALF